jgi:hypothetical protein
MIVVSMPPASDGHHHHPADVPSLLLTIESGVLDLKLGEIAILDAEGNPVPKK